MLCVYVREFCFSMVNAAGESCIASNSFSFFAQSKFAKSLETLINNWQRQFLRLKKPQQFKHLFFFSRLFVQLLFPAACFIQCLEMVTEGNKYILDLSHVGMPHSQS